MTYREQIYKLKIKNYAKTKNASIEINNQSVIDYLTKVWDK